MDIWLFSCFLDSCDDRMTPEGLVEENSDKNVKHKSHGMGYGMGTTDGYTDDVNAFVF